MNVTLINNTRFFIPLLLAGCSLLAACGETASTPTDSVAQRLSVDLEFPDSMTGGRVISNLKQVNTLQPTSLASKASTGEPCAFIGLENEQELLTNGYHTTRFLVSTMATWTCIADILIDIADVVVHDGSIIETDNDTQAANYDADEPTHYSVTNDNDTQTSIRLYYAFDRANPPTHQDKAQFYISWNESSPGTIEGRLIIDSGNININTRKPDDPVKMRMDFNFNQDSKHADMFLQFDDNNPWANGMRIDIDKDLTVNLLDRVYTARGMINMKGQFFEATGISEIPDIKVFTVADGLGNGASIGEVQNMSLPLELNHNQNNYLGDYLFTKQDVYFFEEDMDWDYINKSFTAAEYRGGRTTPASGGSWLPFNPSLDMIISALSLDPGYFSGDLCVAINDDCSSLLNAIFANGFADQEQNQGTDPGDWRSIALQSAVYLATVYPNGEDWEGAFEQSFTPSP